MSWMGTLYVRRVPTPQTIYLECFVLHHEYQCTFSIMIMIEIEPPQYPEYPRFRTSTPPSIRNGSVAKDQSSNCMVGCWDHSQYVGNKIPKTGNVSSVDMFVKIIRTKDSRLCAIWVHAPTSIVVVVDGEIIKPLVVFCWGRTKYNRMSMFWK
jgi:hypothetical protein